ncbi:Glia maturation factor gamma [Thelohanellus kitauei]|uniref:Glia maturation factor gamma n=1 Tax=Thelohanellus kitauei TaxID=669202 RepID=A0A0C2N8T4_THEKT|nr:Glia maturation factor gamma [Thelohanellus kitauei]KII72735.1 Glia maturation factor gamma [Thelohanellus kitauei]
MSKNAVEKLKSFRSKKFDQSAAIIVKIDIDQQTIDIEDEFTDISIEELADQIPEQQPRYIGYTVKRQTNDGRTTYPLMLIYHTPNGAKHDQQMMYSTSIGQIYSAGGFTKSFEIRDVDELNDEWLEEKLSFYR